MPFNRNLANIQMVDAAKCNLLSVGNVLIYIMIYVCRGAGAI